VIIAKGDKVAVEAVVDLAPNTSKGKGAFILRVIQWGSVAFRYACHSKKPSAKNQAAVLRKGIAEERLVGLVSARR